MRAGSGVRLESNLFLGLNFTNIEIDTSQAGFARFNRFIYTRVQTNLQTHLRLIGDPAKQSYGNTILWFQSLGAGASGLVIQDQTDLALLDVGGEVWASGQNGVIDDDDKRSPLLRAATTPGSAPARVFVLNLNGGNILGWPTGLAEFGVDELFAIGLNQTGPLGSPRIVLGETNRRFVSIHQSMGDLITAPHDPNPWLSADEQSSVIRDEATQRELRLVESHVESPERKLYLDGVAPQQAAIRAAISPPARVGEPWERPRLDPIPDPVGPNWRAGLAEARDPNGALDSSAYIQGLIDSPSIGYLPEGVWYISQPLRFRRGKGLRGAGMGKTAIVAKSAEIDMIINDDQISFPGTFQDGVDVAYATDVPIYLMDLTLQGGKNGIHHAKETAGDLAQFTSMLISHVQFRELSESGIFIDRVYAWDTNLVDNVIFLDCKQSAIKQRVEQHTGEAPGLGYMDKNFFYESQFIGSQIALDQQGGRASGGNVYASSLFRDNGIVALQVAHSADLFANSDFIDNGGSEAQPMISNNGWVDLVSCSVHADKAQVLFRGLFDVEGSSFFRGSASTVQLVSSSQPNNALYMTNSTLDFPVGGTIAQGLLANVAFAADDQRFFAHTHFIAGNAVTTVVDGEAESPRPQLLVGTRFD